jgi:hypothetical protein
MDQAGLPKVMKRDLSNLTGWWRQKFIVRARVFVDSLEKFKTGGLASKLFPDLNRRKSGSDASRTLRL